VPAAPGTDGARAIENLVHTYAERIDAGDLDGVAELFAHGRIHGVEGGGAETVFEPADYPPSPRRGSCAFVRGGGDEVWLRYEHCLFKKSRPGS